MAGPVSGPGWKECSRSFAPQTDADRFLHSVETDKLRGEWTDPRLGRITFGEWSARVDAGQLNAKESTKASYGSVLRSLLLPSFGEVRLASIDPGDVREWVSDLVDRGYSPSTIRRVYTLLQEALELAVGDQLIPRSPCRNIALPKIQQTEKRFLSIEEVEHLAKTIRPRYRTFVLTGAYTGLRLGELAALQVDHLDLLPRRLRAEEPVKTPAARRSVSFPAFLADELAAHVAAFPGRDGLVFSSPEGAPFRLSQFRRRIWYPGVRTPVGEPMRSSSVSSRAKPMSQRSGPWAKSATSTNT